MCMGNDMPTKHWPLGGSTAHIWINCNAMPIIKRLVIGEALAGEAAQRGTMIHEQAEQLLSGKEVPDADEVAIAYANDVKATFSHRLIELEQSYNDIAGGTIDGVALKEGAVWIWDLKTGRERVDPEGNSQLTFYAYLLNKVGHVTGDPMYLGIWQDGSFNWWKTSFYELALIYAVIDTAIDRIKNWGSRVSANPGSHCKWCKAKTACGAYMRNIPNVTRPSDTLSKEELVELFERIPAIESALKEVDSVVTDAIKSGEVGGWSMVPGKTKPAQWRTDVTLPEQLYSKSPPTPAQAKKQFPELDIDSLSFRPEPNLVPKKDAP